MVHAFLKVDLYKSTSRPWLQLDPWQYKHLKEHRSAAALKRFEKLYRYIQPSDLKEGQVKIRRISANLSYKEWTTAGIVFSRFRSQLTQSRIMQLLKESKRDGVDPCAELNLISQKIERREKWCAGHALTRQPPPLPLSTPQTRSSAPIRTTAKTSIKTKKSERKYGVKNYFFKGRGNRSTYHATAPYPSTAYQKVVAPSAKSRTTA